MNKKERKRLIILSELWLLLAIPAYYFILRALDHFINYNSTLLEVMLYIILGAGAIGVSRGYYLGMSSRDETYKFTQALILGAIYVIVGRFYFFILTTLLTFGS